MIIHVKEYREKAKLSQTELANLVGVSRTTISNIEVGVFCPTAYVAGLLCRALNASFDQLFEFIELEEIINE